jgi:leucyl-tRNA synthetase
MMPYEATAPWNPGAISGIFRFLKRVWDLQNNLNDDSELSSEDEYWLNKTVKKVGKDLEEIHFNTAVSSLMEWLNYISAKKSISKIEYKTFLKLLAPFAPHMTEEVWSLIDTEFPSKSIHLEKWPEFDKAKIVQDEVTIAVQINGKVRGTIKVESSKIESQPDVEDIAKADQNISKYLEGVQIKKTIYIKGKIISFVV